MEVEILFLAQVAKLKETEGVAVAINIVPKGKYKDATKVIPHEFITNLKSCKTIKIVNVTMDEMKDGLYKKIASSFYNELKQFEK